MSQLWCQYCNDLFIWEEKCLSHCQSCGEQVCDDCKVDGVCPECLEDEGKKL